jgi:type I restriction enzyme S subunit
MNWLPATVGDACLSTSQTDPARSGAATFRYVDIAGVDRDTKAISRAEVLACAEAPSRARKLIRSFDVLVSTVRPNLNAVAFVPPELDGEIASTGFAVLRANPELLNSKFLFYWVQHREFVEFLVANATGASYPAVTDGVVKRARLPLATPKEQSRIVELLDEANLLRRLRREADAKAARILPTLFLKMFGDPATNPKGLRKVPLGKIIKVKSGDFLPAKDMAKKGTYPVYGGNGINGLHDAFMFEEPKIVLGRVGAYCGVVHYSRRNAWITDNALYVSEKLEPIEDQYLVAALEHANLNQYAGRAGQPLISGSRIYPVEILVPAEVEQLAFARSVSDLRKVNDLLDVASQKLDFLWDTMMTRAFSGQLTAKWRDGHMKELLAEMEQQAQTLNRPVQLETTS